MNTITFFKKPKISQFAYFYVLVPGSASKEYVYKKIIKPAISSVKKRYGIEVKPLAWKELPKTNKINYVLYGPSEPLKLSDEEKGYLQELSKVAKVNLVSAYELDKNKDTPFYRKNSGTLVPEISKKLDINIIFPDNLDYGQQIRTTDWEDVRDNIVCETLRVKYDPIFIKNKTTQNKLQGLQGEFEKEIKSLTGTYKKFELWHRDRTDGAILLVGESGCLASQTKTDKTCMTIDDFSLIEEYNSRNNLVRYLGKKIPSSDAPEFLVLSDLMKKDGDTYKMLVHFHLNSLTRNKRFAKYLTRGKIEYGRFSSGKLIFQEFKKKKTDWLILLEHGIVWRGNTAKEFSEFIKRII